MTSTAFKVDLPSGGSLSLNSVDEVELWNESAKRYISDYSISKQNDLILVGAILSQQLVMYRAQMDLADPKKVGGSQSMITKAAEEIRGLEKALGIDKKTREQGGAHTVADYIGTLKRAAHARGVHLSERTKKYEAFNNELRWKIRLLRNGDAEDRAYHALTEAAVIDWAAKQLGEIEESDKDWAKTKGAVFVGKL